MSAKTSIGGFLALAITQEKDLARFYAEAAAKTQSVSLSNLFQSLAREETEHDAFGEKLPGDSGTLIAAIWSPRASPMKRNSASSPGRAPGG